MAGQNKRANDERTLREYATPSLDSIASSIRRPVIEAKHFEIKPALIQMIQTSVQFGGLANDDPIAHIVNFLEICDTVKYNGVTDDAIRLRLFPFSLRDKAKQWLNSLPPRSITTWDELAQIFLSKFFPLAKTAKMKNDIVNFCQFEGESLYEAWERYKDLIRKCPHNGLSTCSQVQIFYDGLCHSVRTWVDVAAGGALMNKTYDEAYELLEKMADNDYQWPSERATTKQDVRVYEDDALTALQAHVEVLSKKRDFLTDNAIQNPISRCELCGGSHNSMKCHVGSPFRQAPHEQANFVSNFQQQNNPYSNAAYNSGWTNRPNFVRNNNNNVKLPPTPQDMIPHVSNNASPLENKISLEDALAQLTIATSQFMARIDLILQNQATSIRNLEVQVGQIAKLLNERAKCTKVNPKEQAHAIIPKNGQEVEEPKNKSASKEIHGVEGADNAKEVTK